MIHFTYILYKFFTLHNNNLKRYNYFNNDKTTSLVCKNCEFNTIAMLLRYWKSWSFKSSSAM